MGIRKYKNIDIYGADVIVLLSTYNGEKYLKEQLDSLLLQTVADEIFIFIRDDGSKDNTQDIIKKYIKKYKNIYMYQGENVGSAKSFHLLLHDAPIAKYYMFCDQDDVWLPPKIENALNCMKNKKGPVLYGSRKVIVDDKLKNIDLVDPAPASLNQFNVFLQANAISGCTIMFDDLLRELYLKCKNIPMEVYHDSWMVKLASLFGSIVYSDVNKDILYRQHNNNVVGYQNVGYKQFIDRMSRFDITMKCFRTRNFTSKIAERFLLAYDDDLSIDAKQLLFDLSHVKTDWRCRIRLFLRNDLKCENKYEYIAYKFFVLFGWV